MAKFIAHSPNGQAYQCDSLAEVKQVEGGFKFRKAKKRNGGCGCHGACGNPHCGPKKRNGKTPADQHQFARWEEKAKAATDAQLLYVIKDAREAAKAMRGHDPVSEGWYEDEANTYASELYRRRQGKRRNPAGQGEEYNMAAFAGAVEHGLLPPKSATPDYKKGYAEGARIAKVNKTAVAAALGAFRASGSQAKAGELLREMAGTASTSTPIGNPRSSLPTLDNGKEIPHLTALYRQLAKDRTLPKKFTKEGLRKMEVYGWGSTLDRATDYAAYFASTRHQPAYVYQTRRSTLPPSWLATTDATAALAASNVIAGVQHVRSDDYVRVVSPDLTVKEHYILSRNPRKKRRNGLDPRYVPVSNPKPKGKYLAHEKEEEQIFASMLTKLPVGVTMKAGKFRVRKLSKGFVVIDGERLSMKDAAAKLHGR